MASNNKQTITASEFKLPVGEIALWAQLKGQPGWVREYRFAPPRKWRFDFANPAIRLAVEIDGGTGDHRHGTVWGREADNEKRNEAVARGWRVLVGSTEQAQDGRLLAFIRRCNPNP